MAALARASLALARTPGSGAYLYGCAPHQRRVGAACKLVPWSIGAGNFEVAVFPRAIRLVGSSSLPADRALLACGLCGRSIGENMAGHPLEAPLAQIGVVSWR